MGYDIYMLGFSLSSYFLGGPDPIAVDLFQHQASLTTGGPMGQSQFFYRALKTNLRIRLPSRSFTVAVYFPILILSPTLGIRPSLSRINPEKVS